MSLSDAYSETGAECPDAGVGSGGDYAVKLAIFEGPLDLLLHLIRQNEVKIADIPIAEISRQYLDYIEVMEELNIDVAAEYLLMASTLALIKSRMLLPAESDSEAGEILDPRAELVARLLEYQRFKEAAEELAKRRRLGRDVFRAEAPGPEPTPEAEREIEVGLFELIEAFRSVLQEARDQRPTHEIEAEDVTVHDRMVHVMDFLEKVEKTEFTRIFESEGDGRAPSRAVLVATFLALLELARLGALRLFQGMNELGVPEGAIHMRMVRDAQTDLSWRERVTDPR